MGTGEGVRFILTGARVIINIYASNDIEGRRRLWEELKKKKESSNIDWWCLICDFNCVRRACERTGVGGEDGNVSGYYLGSQLLLL